MSFKTTLSVLMLFSLLSCTQTDPVTTDPLIGTWVWVSGSRTITPAGFERLHRDRSETYLVGDADMDFVFGADAKFENTLVPPSEDPIVHTGNW